MDETMFNVGVELVRVLRQRRALGTHYSYNGVVLPKLPEWDKTVYPYAWISSFNSSLSMLFLSTKPVYRKNYIPAETTYKRALAANASDNSWGNFADGSTGTTYAVTSTPFWANHDILNEDGTVYLAASEPMPV